MVQSIMETIIYGILALAALAALVCLFLDLIELAARSGRRNKKVHEDEDEDAEEEEPGEVMRREAFWVCYNCDQEFRIDSNNVPRFCPGCGSPVVDNGDTAPDECDAATYTCPNCFTRFVLLDGDFPECCPSCGYGNRPEDTMAFTLEEDNDPDSDEE